MNFKITFYNFSGCYVHHEHQNAKLMYSIEAKTHWPLLNLRNIFPMLNQDNVDYIEFCEMNHLKPIFASDIQSKNASGWATLNGNEISYYFYNQDFTEEYKKMFFSLFKGWTFNAHSNKIVLVGTEEELDRYQKNRNEVIIQPQRLNPIQAINDYGANNKENVKNTINHMINNKIEKLDNQNTQRFENGANSNSLSLPSYLDFSSKDQINRFVD